MVTFLTAKWKYLIMVNYAIDPAVLLPYIPKGTEIDLWNGRAYVSLVGFMFQDTYVRGLSIPFHRHFEEVNLRFYIKHNDKRGVAFIKEIVPRRGIAWVARLLYNENYVCLPMRHTIEHKASQINVEYGWKIKGQWQSLQASSHGEPEYAVPGSEEEFITEHYFGYSTQRNGSTMEYQVEHPPWRIWKIDQLNIDIDTKTLYGPVFAPFLEEPPVSAFLAEGSEVSVFKGSKLR